MFGIKSRKKIKELECQLTEVTKVKNDLASANDSLKQQNSKLISEMISYRQQCNDQKHEIDDINKKYYDLQHGMAALMMATYSPIYKRDSKGRFIKTTEQDRFDYARKIVGKIAKK
ncbi:hypothetical protein DXA95_12380 [Odoribacter sp. OF09-27XD]|nr:hypothetical protein [Odoribacter sp. OF09-27XD]RHV92595.1 hypothetical protein DXA95_12380 [Odoribacter sp. OF09-27XD]